LAYLLTAAPVVGTDRLCDHWRPLASTPVNANTTVAGSGFHWISILEASVPSAAICVAPKNDGTADVKFVPLIVKPVIFVATLAVSCSRTVTAQPLLVWEIEFGATDTTTFEAVAALTPTVADPAEPPKDALPP
jgi:hypothetical protein